MRKVFVPYHHGDQEDVDKFVRDFSDVCIFFDFTKEMVNIDSGVGCSEAVAKLHPEVTRSFKVVVTA